jgi:ribonuclease HII
MLTAGVDEAGRGCLAGPVVAAAVILPADFRPPPGLPELTDSKLLDPQARDLLAPAIRERALAWSIGVSWPPEIDRINILQATFMAMLRAVRQLRTPPQYLLVDGNRPLPTRIPHRCIVDGDLLEPCISAASVVAKVFRDRLMAKLDRRYPGYNLARHKGYATREHYGRLAELGPTRMHRLSFRGVAVAEEQLCLPGI